MLFRAEFEHCAEVYFFQVKLGQNDYWCMVSIVRDNINEDVHAFQQSTAPPAPGILKEQ